MTRRFALIALLFALTSAQTTTQSKQISLDPNAGPLKLRIVFQSEQPPQVLWIYLSFLKLFYLSWRFNKLRVLPVTVSPRRPWAHVLLEIVAQFSQFKLLRALLETAESLNRLPHALLATAMDLSLDLPMLFQFLMPRSTRYPKQNFQLIVLFSFQTTTPMPIPIRTISSNTAPIKVIRVPSYSNSNNGCFSPPCGAPRFIFAQPPCFGNSCGPRFMFPRRRHFFGPRPIIIGNRNNGNINAGGNVAVPDTIYKNGMAIRAPIRVPSSYQDGNPVFNSGK